MEQRSDTRKLIERVLNGLPDKERANALAMVAEIGEFSLDSAYWYPFLMAYKLNYEMREAVRLAAAQGSEPISRHYRDTTRALSAFGQNVQDAVRAVNDAVTAYNAAAQVYNKAAETVGERTSAQVDYAVATVTRAIDERIDERLDRAIPTMLSAFTEAAATKISGHYISWDGLLMLFRKSVAYFLISVVLLLGLGWVAGYQYKAKSAAVSPPLHHAQHRPANRK